MLTERGRCIRRRRLIGIDRAYLMGMEARWRILHLGCEDGDGRMVRVLSFEVDGEEWWGAFLKECAQSHVEQVSTSFDRSRGHIETINLSPAPSCGAHAACGVEMSPVSSADTAFNAERGRAKLMPSMVSEERRGQSVADTACQ
jgi:hypothetical protein